MPVTPCIRCGKERVLLKKWTEKPEGKGATITFERYICPDSECQKILDEQFEKMRLRREESENRKVNLHLKKN